MNRIKTSEVMFSMLDEQNHGFIPPINFGALSLGAGSDRRVVRFQQPLDCLWSLLKCPLQRAPRLKTPTIQISTHGSDRQINQKAKLKFIWSTMDSSLRAQQFELAQASMPMRHGFKLAKNGIISLSLSFCFRTALPRSSAARV
jgi:hypothetical protein